MLKKTKKNKAITVILVFILAFTMMPFYAFAGVISGPGEIIRETVEKCYTTVVADGDIDGYTLYNISDEMPGDVSDATVSSVINNYREDLMNWANGLGAVETSMHEGISGATYTAYDSIFGRGDDTVIRTTRERHQTYTITLTGKKGSVEPEVVIKGTTIKKLVKGKKSFTVKWAKQSKKMPKNRITGYQVQYSKAKDFSAAKKTIKIKGYKVTSKKVNKLKAKTKYYVRVRTYMNVSGKTYYSAWSKAKAVTTK